jgi:hypothetical protein
MKFALGAALTMMVVSLGAPPALAQTGDAPPPGLVTIQNTGESGTAQCGPIRVAWDNHLTIDPGTTGSASLHATAADGSTILDLARSLTPGERFLPRWCMDALGDGTQVLAYETFSGGAHCCFSSAVLLLEPDGRHLLDADLGNGGLGTPRQLGSGGPQELLADSDVFAYFDDLSFAASPFMPLIYQYDGQQYTEATRQFPDYLQTQIDHAQADLTLTLAHPAPDQLPLPLAYQGQESMALKLYALHVLRGDGDAALPAIQAQLSPPAAGWLGANAPDAQTALAGVYAGL